MLGMAWPINGIAPVHLMSAVLNIESEVAPLRRPAEVLDCLHTTVAAAAGLSVCNAWRLPLHIGLNRSLAIGRDIFVHPSVPKAFWPPLLDGIHKNGPSPIEARASGTPIGATWTEIARQTGARGKQRWIFDLARDHGMRDGYQVPVGVWRLNYWSSQVIKQDFRARILLDVAAGRVVAKLTEITKARRKRPNAADLLSPRELAVLQFISLGRSDLDIADALELSRNSVRTLMQRAREKLGATSLAHAVSLAIRMGLMGCALAIWTTELLLVG